MQTHLELEALRAFVGIVDHGGFSAAAGRLGRTQSAISLQIKRLEQGLGQVLLQRVQGRVTGPTAEGLALLPYARQMLHLNDVACAALQPDARPGSLRLGLPEELMETAFPAALPAFRSRYPRLRLFVHTDTAAGLRTALAEGRLDLAIYKDCAGLPPAAGEVLSESPLCWTVGEPYRDPVGEGLGEPLPLALFGENCVFRIAALAALSQAGIPSALHYTGSSTTGLRHALRHGLGVGVLPAYLLGDGLVAISHYGELQLPPLPTARLVAAFAAGEVAGVTRQLLAELRAVL